MIALVAARLAAAGAPHTYDRVPGLWHDFVLYTGAMAEADAAVARESARQLGPVDERAMPFGKTVMLFDGVSRDALSAYGETRIPGLADLFVATMKGTYA